ncbi:hypothetical protein JR316_0005224 [Psilocybe cubensis]|nr:hypothetical protein JR316_0005224 [Psilocybe cubensis]KAH9483123.1 hypothetical protein JR316_0005224 [Psilocybe cubensis]
MAIDSTWLRVRDSYSRFIFQEKYFGGETWRLSVNEDEQALPPLYDTAAVIRKIVNKPDPSKLIPDVYHCFCDISKLLTIADGDSQESDISNLAYITICAGSRYWQFLYDETTGSSVFDWYPNSETTAAEDPSLAYKLLHERNKLVFLDYLVRNGIRPEYWPHRQEVMIRILHYVYTRNGEYPLMLEGNDPFPRYLRLIPVGPSADPRQVPIFCQYLLLMESFFRHVKTTETGLFFGNLHAHPGISNFLEEASTEICWLHTDLVDSQSRGHQQASHAYATLMESITAGLGEVFSENRYHNAMAMFYYAAIFAEPIKRALKMLPAHYLDAYSEVTVAHARLLSIIRSKKKVIYNQFQGSYRDFEARFVYLKAWEPQYARTDENRLRFTPHWWAFLYGTDSSGTDSIMPMPVNLVQPRQFASSPEPEQQTTPSDHTTVEFIVTASSPELK